MLYLTELLVFPATPALQHDFTIQLGYSTIAPSSSVRNLGVIFDDQLTFKDHIPQTARSSRFALHNIRKIRPFVTEHATQLLIQALVISRLDYCNALLAGLPSNTIKPLQMIQNAAARLVFNEPKKAHVTPLFVSLHWLPVAARIKFKTLMLAYRTTSGSAPSYFHSLLRIYIPSRSLRSAGERRLDDGTHHREAQNHSPEHSRSPFLTGGMIFPSLSFKQELKTHLFRHWWLARRSCLAFCWFGSWCCGTVCLMVATRRVHGSGGRSLWWSSVLSSHIAGCRCPGGREAHIRRCPGPSDLFSAGLSGWEWCSSRTQWWCSQSGCSLKCKCRSVWGFLSSDRISSVAWGRRDAGGPSSLLTVCE